MSVVVDVCRVDRTHFCAMTARDWPDLENLARETERRRRTLGLKQDDLKARGGPSHTTVRAIETQNWQPRRMDTLDDLDKALRLRPGSARRALSGYAFDVLDEEKAAFRERPRTTRIDVTDLTEEEIAALHRFAERKAEEIRQNRNSA